MGSVCTTTRQVAIDVIPDKQVMLEIVDAIVTLEELLKRGQKPTKVQESQISQVKKVPAEMTNLKKISDESKQ